AENYRFVCQPARKTKPEASGRAHLPIDGDSERSAAIPCCLGCRLEACATKRDLSFITDSAGFLAHFTVNRKMRSIVPRQKAGARGYTFSETAVTGTMEEGRLRPMIARPSAS